MAERPIQRGDLLMPVTDDHAARLIEIEALRSIADAAKQQTQAIGDLRNDMREDRKLLHDIHGRVIKIESNRLDSQVESSRKAIEELGKRVNDLERDKDRRDGAVSAFDWALKNWPGIAGFIGLIVMILVLTGKMPK